MFSLAVRVADITQKGSAGAPALRQPYLRVLGLELDTSLASSPGSRAFSPEEEEEFQALARSEDLYDRFAKSVAPSIFGSLGTFFASLVHRLTCRYQESDHLSFDGREQEDLA